MGRVRVTGDTTEDSLKSSLLTPLYTVDPGLNLLAHVRFTFRC